MGERNASVMIGKSAVFEQRICVRYAPAMAKDGPMKNRVIRVDDATWAEFAAYCDEKGISMSDELRMYIRERVAERRRRLRREARES